MKKYLIFSIFLLIILSCKEKKGNTTFQQIKEIEYSRNPDTVHYSQILKNSSFKEKKWVFQSISRISHKSYIAFLKNQYHKNNSLIRKEILFALGQIGTPAAETLLLSLYNRSDASHLHADIINALGKCANKKGATFLLNNLKSFNDSLKVQAIYGLSFIYKRNPKIYAIPDTINSYLNQKSKIIKNAAIYFFNRHAYLPAIYNILNADFSNQSIAYKYKLSGLSKILNIHAPDSVLLDSINKNLFSSSFFTESDWHKLMYKIRLMSFYPDSIMTYKIASFLNNESPHVRIEAIKSLGKIKSDISKNLLLEYYDRTGWSEKGLIILNLASRYPKFIYRLIQQNLDQGTLYFKELLLQSLAKLNDHMSRTQLKQFLNVPELRLQATAFNELDKLRKLSYKNVQNFLLSGNEMLTSYATFWISKRPQYGKLPDLIEAYSKFKDPQHVETLVNILQAINKLKQQESIVFLDSIYINTQNPDIAKTAAIGLSQFDIELPQKTFSGNSLFVPDSIIYETEPLNITIRTEKGDIEVELYPEDSPITVSHLIYLIKKGYYKNQIFHRVVSDFVIQGGDPSGTGWGGPGYAIPCEYNDKPYLRGSVGLATAGKDTGGSQFFICHSEQPHLNRRYTNFGKVINGMDVVDQITKDDKILNIVLN